MRIAINKAGADNRDTFNTAEITRETLLSSHNRPGKTPFLFIDNGAGEWLSFFDFEIPDDVVLMVDVAHGDLRSYYYKPNYLVPVFDNRSFPAREAADDEWYEYMTYEDTPEGREHFKGYADPFDTPEEDLRVYLWAQFSICEAYTLLKFTYPEITPAELLADLRETDSKGQILPGELAAVFELGDFLKQSNSRRLS